MPHPLDLPLDKTDVLDLTSADCIAAWLSRLGYDTGRRQVLTAGALGLNADVAGAVREAELLAEDEDELLRVCFLRLRSLTARARTELARTLGRRNPDHLLILASDFENLEFVLIHKSKRDRPGPAGLARVQAIPLTMAVRRRDPGRRELRVLRRLTWTCRDGLEQFEKLRVAFEAAAYTGEYFHNRALFADHFLLERVPEDPAWRENPAAAFTVVRGRLRQQERGKRDWFEAVFGQLGFRVVWGKRGRKADVRPHAELQGADGGPLTAVFVYPWERWLDGPDSGADPDSPEENPGATVVTALEGGADWLIVTNGRQWRLYSRHTHARAVNFYEVDLAEALAACGDSDPGEAFRYWWLFFRPEAFRRGPDGCWLDRLVQGSRDYARRLGDHLKGRIFLHTFPRLAAGFLEDRSQRLGKTATPDAGELQEVFEATLTLLYRLLFLLYAESRELLPVREDAYFQVSLKKLKEEVAERGGVAEGEVARRLAEVYGTDKTGLYDRLAKLFEAIDRGDPQMNVPIYEGGLFRTTPGGGGPRSGRRASWRSTRCPTCTWRRRWTGWRGCPTSGAADWALSITSLWKCAIWARSTRGCWSSS
jgi:hypothetical protein